MTVVSALGVDPAREARPSVTCSGSRLIHRHRLTTSSRKLSRARSPVALPNATTAVQGGSDYPLTVASTIVRKPPSLAKQ